MLQAYGALYGASAVGANNLLRYAAGGVAPLFTNQMYNALGIGVSSSSRYQEIDSNSSHVVGGEPDCVRERRTVANSVRSIQIWPANSSEE